MDPFVSTLILILLALLGARFSFSTVRVPPGPRLVFRTGTHFLLLGFVLGPQLLGLLTEDAVRQLFPLLGMGLGWIGFLFGLQLDHRNLRQFPLGFHLHESGGRLLHLALDALKAPGQFGRLPLGGDAVSLQMSLP